MIAVAMLTGLLAALGWGAADYLAGGTAKLVGIRRTALFTQSVGWLAVSLLLLAMPPLREKALVASNSGWLHGVLAVAFNLAGSVSLLRAFSLGRASLVAPLITSYAAVTAFLGVAISGDRLSGFRLAGILVCLIGAPLAAVAPKHQDARGDAGVGYALLTAFCFGVGFWVQGKFAVPAIGATPMLWLFFSIGILALAPTLLLRRDAMLPSRDALPLLVLQSVCNLVGYGTFAIGMATGAVTIVTVLSTFAAAITAVFGLALRRERLSHAQAIGVSAILIGAVLLAV
ncbi:MULTISPECIES: DMT family transporter [unclassified Novosphingobium]|uniref:DMT family transporter n=1 Tax=unclassified Novosphingobium TaxID=2644732 RepID=UPI001494579A|nr:drug/metabolite transporter (DMT)-like permease [Novosphingobium sp. BK256]MBB3373321.1 drug/metabolite transporter (DMT)-like permease [Novosphingobium sp. BK280]MBB3377690.1 drug/metabolite transporter (DMT)-like permease [Novosphingobium sp. BK258]MBB3418899.1 drug/metabolite transporter (DMT)-like permease [Novosphingobium sp. BK267]MBB3450266.1 drug/metabolite transporter (DMT)-like permease [Novosphingobium sp. BK352]MBB3476606.1 drug/metabolite transporter (DMT)-like permease [Novosp